jgi:ankyrin repeat protein
MVARDGSVEKIWALEKEGAHVVGYDGEGLSALHYAAYYGNVETVRVILELGGSAHAQFVTTLHLGAETKGHTESARRSVEMGCDLSARATDGSTPLHLAVSRGHAEIVRLLVKGGRRRACTGRSWEHTATSCRWCWPRGNGQLFLGEDGGSILAAQEADGDTPLHRAAVGGHE